MDKLSSFKIQEDNILLLILARPRCLCKLTIASSGDWHCGSNTKILSQQEETIKTQTNTKSTRLQMIYEFGNVRH
jgi:hypothetical protein